MAAAPFTDPQWSQSASVCIACGYSLSGLSARGLCPECGATYEDFQLVLWGVPNKSSNTPPLRRALWALAIGGSIAHVYTWALQMMSGGLWLVGIITAALAGLIIALVATGPRERRGTERFIVTSGGIARVASKVDPGAIRLDTIFIPWGAADSVQIDRVSAFWKRIRIGRLSDGLYGKIRDVIFDAGIRCPDSDVEPVRDAILNNIRKGPQPLIAPSGPISAGQHIDLNPPPSAPSPP